MMVELMITMMLMMKCGVVSQLMTKETSMGDEVDTELQDQVRLFSVLGSGDTCLSILRLLYALQ